MHDKDWVLVDTETTGFVAPIMVVELGAQRMRGWEKFGPSFRELLNQNADIPPEASRVHGYTREILERDGIPARDVYGSFAAYAGGLPIVSYNLNYDLDKVLKPEWMRLGIAPIGPSGFCAYRLAQRLLDPVPAGNCKLQTLRQYYRLPERGAHTALGDVETVIDLIAQVLRPISERKGIRDWDGLVAAASDEWYPSRIAFGKFKGRDYRDAREDNALKDWLSWLARSSNRQSASMGNWYLGQLEGNEGAEDASDLSAFPDENVGIEHDAGPTATGYDLISYVDPDLDRLRKLIAAARTRLAGLQAAYTQDHRAVALMQASIFGMVRQHYQKRDQLRLLVDYRQKYLSALLQSGEDEAGEVASEYNNAREQTDSSYEEAAEAAASQQTLSTEQKAQLQLLWKKLVSLFHPDRFSGQPKKAAAYNQLLAVINKARDEGDIELLRAIAEDPTAFMMSKGWVGLDLGEEHELRAMRRLYSALQAEIVSSIELLNTLHASPDFELLNMSQTQPGMLKKVADDQIAALASEIAELEAEALRLKLEITELAGADACSID